MLSLLGLSADSNEEKGKEESLSLGRIDRACLEAQVARRAGDANDRRWVPYTVQRTKGSETSKAVTMYVIDLGQWSESGEPRLAVKRYRNFWWLYGKLEPLYGDDFVNACEFPGRGVFSARALEASVEFRRHRFNRLLRIALSAKPIAEVLIKWLQQGLVQPQSREQDDIIAMKPRGIVLGLSLTSRYSAEASSSHDKEQQEARHNVTGKNTTTTSTTTRGTEEKMKYIIEEQNITAAGGATARLCAALLGTSHQRNCELSRHARADGQQMYTCRIECGDLHFVAVQAFKVYRAANELLARSTSRRVAQMYEDDIGRVFPATHHKRLFGLTLSDTELMQREARLKEWCQLALFGALRHLDPDDQHDFLATLAFTEVATSEPIIPELCQINSTAVEKNNNADDNKKPASTSRSSTQQEEEGGQEDQPANDDDDNSALPVKEMRARAKTVSFDDGLPAVPYNNDSSSKNNAGTGRSPSIASPSSSRRSSKFFGVGGGRKSVVSYKKSSSDEAISNLDSSSIRLRNAIVAAEASVEISTTRAADHSGHPRFTTRLVVSGYKNFSSIIFIAKSRAFKTYRAAYDEAGAIYDRLTEFPVTYSKSKFGVSLTVDELRDRVTKLDAFTKCLFDPTNFTLLPAERQLAVLERIRFVEDGTAPVSSPSSGSKVKFAEDTSHDNYSKEQNKATSNKKDQLSTDKQQSILKSQVLPDVSDHRKEIPNSIEALAIKDEFVDDDDDDDDDEDNSNLDDCYAPRGKSGRLKLRQSYVDTLQTLLSEHEDTTKLITALEKDADGSSGQLTTDAFAAANRTMVRRQTVAHLGRELAKQIELRFQLDEVVGLSEFYSGAANPSLFERLFSFSREPPKIAVVAKLLGLSDNDRKFAVEVDHLCESTSASFDPKWSPPAFATFTFAADRRLAKKKLLLRVHDAKKLQRYQEKHQDKYRREKEAKDMDKSFRNSRFDINGNDCNKDEDSDDDDYSEDDEEDGADDPSVLGYAVVTDLGTLANRALQREASPADLSCRVDCRLVDDENMLTSAKVCGSISVRRVADVIKSESHAVKQYCAIIFQRRKADGSLGDLLARSINMGSPLVRTESVTPCTSACLVQVRNVDTACENVHCFDAGLSGNDQPTVVRNEILWVPLGYWVPIDATKPFTNAGKLTEEEIITVPLGLSDILPLPAGEFVLEDWHQSYTGQEDAMGWQYAGFLDDSTWRSAPFGAAQLRRTVWYRLTTTDPSARHSFAAKSLQNSGLLTSPSITHRPSSLDAFKVGRRRCNANPSPAALQQHIHSIAAARNLPASAHSAGAAIPTRKLSLATTVRLKEDEDEVYSTPDSPSLKTISESHDADE